LDVAVAKPAVVGMTGSSLAKIVLAARARLAFFEAIPQQPQLARTASASPWDLSWTWIFGAPGKCPARPAKIVALLT
jgi:hypothetical protein